MRLIKRGFEGLRTRHKRGQRCRDSSSISDRRCGFTSSSLIRHRARALRQRPNGPHGHELAPFSDCLMKKSYPFSLAFRALCVCLITCFSACSHSEASPTGVSVTTQRYDNGRTGQNLSETILNTSNVNPARFGKLFTRAVDDGIYAQPLYVPNVTVPHVGTRNVLYVATVNNSVYAFDADEPGAATPLWTVNLTGVDARPVNAGDMSPGYGDMRGNIGIVGTPVIDTATQTIYLVARTKEAGEFVQRLHALNITTGAERLNSPVVINASIQGTGTGSSNGVIHFDPRIENQRGALLLANGVVYITWASHSDMGAYHGWIMGYDEATLAQVLAKVVTPTGERGGIWQSGTGPSADAAGNLYLTVGDGTVTAPTGGQDYGDAFLRLSPSGKVLDWFIPHNFEMLNQYDLDLGTAGVLLIPDTSLLTSVSKEGKLYLLDRNNLGHFQPGSDSQIVQSFVVAAGGLYGTPTYWNGPDGPYIYAWGSSDSDPGKMFRLKSDLLITTPVSKTTLLAKGLPGGILSISANGATAGTGILWAVLGLGDASDDATELPPGVLYAFDAADLSRELWNSRQNAARDDLGTLAKFNTPIVANGKVYVATFSKQIVAYGLLSQH
jgi:hypothetical protein